VGFWPWVKKASEAMEIFGGLKNSMVIFPWSFSG